MRLNADLSYAEQQEVRGGITVDVPVTWASANPQVATVDTDGREPAEIAAEVVRAWNASSEE